MKHKPWQHQSKGNDTFDAGRPKNKPRYRDNDESAPSDGPDWVFGVHAVEAILKHNADSIQQLLVLQGRSDQRLLPLLERASRLGINVREVERAELDERTGGVHQGIAALCEGLKLERSEGFLNQMLDGLERPPFLLILDGVTDPHNLGACLRSAEAAGVDAVIVPKDKSALMTSTARKVACGAAEIVPFVTVTNLARCIEALKQRGVWVQGAAGEATQSIYKTDLKGSLAIVLGSEGSGMRRLTRELCDGLFSIPMAGEVSSLNVSVSAGVSLFEAVRQRVAVKLPG
ncbi:MAG: 23S rRNA (guanosine(2251)-2'-O)-methyltransferase RlmB [Pseudomonadota bacterium]